MTKNKNKICLICFDPLWYKLYFPSRFGIMSSWLRLIYRIACLLNEPMPTLAKLGSMYVNSENFVFIGLNGMCAQYFSFLWDIRPKGQEVHIFLRYSKDSKRCFFGKNENVFWTGVESQDDESLKIPCWGKIRQNMKFFEILEHASTNAEIDFLDSGNHSCLACEMRARDDTSQGFGDSDRETVASRVRF